MKNLIKIIRPNRNPKYYQLISSYVERIQRDGNPVLKLTVKDIIQESGISRPTFYSYYENTDEFFLDLLEIFSTYWPLYMEQRSKEMKGKDFLQLAFEMRTGYVMMQLKKLAGNSEAAQQAWRSYFINGVDRMANWYIGGKGVDPETGKKMARLVLNELILHHDIYYDDLKVYTDLMVNQKVVEIQALGLDGA